jgi:hypothetical protein
VRTGRVIKSRGARGHPSPLLLAPTPRVVLPIELRRHYAVCMMRPEERYWVKVSLTIGFVVLVLLLLMISGVVGDMEHIVIDILRAMQ